MMLNPISTSVMAAFGPGVPEMAMAVAIGVASANTPSKTFPRMRIRFPLFHSNCWRCP
jgi:hypothetical protein